MEVSESAWSCPVCGRVLTGEQEFVAHLDAAHGLTEQGGWRESSDNLVVPPSDKPHGRVPLLAWLLAAAVAGAMGLQLVLPIGGDDGDAPVDEIGDVEESTATTPSASAESTTAPTTGALDAMGVESGLVGATCADPSGDFDEVDIFSAVVGSGDTRDEISRFRGGYSEGSVDLTGVELESLPESLNVTWTVAGSASMVDRQSPLPDGGVEYGFIMQLTDSSGNMIYEVRAVFSADGPYQHVGRIEGENHRNIYYGEPEVTEHSITARVPLTDLPRIDEVTHWFALGGITDGGFDGNQTFSATFTDSCPSVGPRGSDGGLPPVQLIGAPFG